MADVDPIRVFYSYAHGDRAVRDRLSAVLAPLRSSKVISEWYDRSIAVGERWEGRIADELDTADVVIALLSLDFLASPYCFEVEMARAFARLRDGSLAVFPILVGPCLWEDSMFRELQLLPRTAQPVLQAPSVDAALADVGKELRDAFKALVPKRRGAASASTPPAAASAMPEPPASTVVASQLSAYARQYELIRQQMKASNERTRRMQAIFGRMKGLAGAAHGLLGSLMSSPSPGERLAAVAVLQAMTDVSALPFLVDRVRSEKPFVGYQAALALLFATEAIDRIHRGALRAAIVEARDALKSAPSSSDTDRWAVLQRALQRVDADDFQALLLQPLDAPR